eukprot:6541034-Pyramimonas_sp.AAC.1
MAWPGKSPFGMLGSSLAASMYTACPPTGSTMGTPPVCSRSPKNWLLRTCEFTCVGGGIVGS